MFRTVRVVALTETDEDEAELIKIKILLSSKGLFRRNKQGQQGCGRVSTKPLCWLRVETIVTSHRRRVRVFCRGSERLRPRGDQVTARAIFLAPPANTRSTRGTGDSSGTQSPTRLLKTWWFSWRATKAPSFTLARTRRVDYDCLTLRLAIPRIPGRLL